MFRAGDINGVRDAAARRERIEPSAPDQVVMGKRRVTSQPPQRVDTIERHDKFDAEIRQVMPRPRWAIPRGHFAGLLQRAKHRIDVGEWLDAGAQHLMEGWNHDRDAVRINHFDRIRGPLLGRDAGVGKHCPGQSRQGFLLNIVASRNVEPVGIIDRRDRAVEQPPVAVDSGQQIPAEEPFPEPPIEVVDIVPHRRRLIVPLLLPAPRTAPPSLLRELAHGIRDVLDVRVDLQKEQAARLRHRRFEQRDERVSLARRKRLEVTAQRFAQAIGAEQVQRPLEARRHLGETSARHCYSSP